MIITMDRHQILHFFENLHEKYNITDGEYKDFVEMLGGKKKVTHFDDFTNVKVVFDIVENEIEYTDDECIPKVNTKKNCSRIWKIIPNETDYHAYGIVSHKYLDSCEMHRSVVERFMKDAGFICMTCDTNLNRKAVLNIISVEKC
jgi:hypothetical protein